MITNNELNALRLSPTNKDYYQIWGELIDTASKISERWDPGSTNEADPGIVLLKVLTAIADKLNYNIDKNILEAFMPTAAQEDSMRRLCDMLGYNIKYYQSATTDVIIRYMGDTYDLSDENDEKLPPAGLDIPAFTPITTSEKDLYYLTTRPVLLTNEIPSVTVSCIEGQRIQCETNNNKIITITNLDSNNRYYFTERAIAENGIFIYNSSNGYKTTAWKKIDNLNTASAGSKVFVFGFDSRENRPYVQFPSDINFLIEDGLEIFYIRTRGAAGNIQARTLTVLEKPTFGDWADFADSEKFSVINVNAALNGRNPETITQAYNGFKKTIGTFDTLVTCRDYMNKIYQLVDDSNVELVSNIIVSDIRDDINRAHTLCSFSDYGIVYIEKANEGDDNTLTVTPPTMDHFDLLLYPFKVYKNINSEDDYNSSFTYSDKNLPLIKAQLADYKTIAHNIIQPESTEIACIKNYLKLNARVATQNKVNVAEETIILSNIRAALFSEFNMRKLDFGEEIPYESILACMENADPRIKSITLDEPVLYTRFMTVNGQEYDIASETIGTSGSNLALAKKLYNKLALKNILAGRIELFNYDNDFRTELGEGSYEGYNTFVDIKAIETSCNKVPNNGKVSLLSNEVIKLRAPNFKTVESFAAYVNYYLHLTNKPVIEASPARFLSLGDLWLQPISPADTIIFANYFLRYVLDDESNHKHLTGNFNTDAGSGVFIHTRHENNAQDPNHDATSVIESAITNYGIVWFLPDANVFNDTEITSKDLINEIKQAIGNNSFKFHLAAKSDHSYPSGHYFTAPLNNTEDTFTLITSIFKNLCSHENCSLSSSANSYITGSTSTHWVPTNKAAYYWPNEERPYRKEPANLSRVPGEYIDIGYAKYILCENVPKPTGKTFYCKSIYYTPAPWRYSAASSETAPNAELTANGWLTGNNVPTTTSKGINAEIYNITPNEEYILKEDEYLCINYTPSTTTSGSEQSSVGTVSSVPVNKYYGPGTIIKPNASTKLYDSKTQHDQLGQSWRKVSGFDFTSHGTNIDGMFSIGPNEQIDIRDFVTVTLDEPVVYLYWILNDTVTLTVDPNNLANSNQSYTLGEGEYLFYTDKHKLDMAYYGSGTEIIFNNTSSYSRTLEFKPDTNNINLEEVLTNGIAAIPWKGYSFGNNTSLTLREYQYVVLTEGDSVENLDTSITNINNTWKEAKAAQNKLISYTIGSTSYDLPKITISRAGDTISWEIRSFLELDVGPDRSQVLHEGNKIILIDSAGESITVEPDPEKAGSTADLAIKTNISCQLTGANRISVESLFGKNISFKVKCLANIPLLAVTSQLGDDTTDLLTGNEVSDITKHVLVNSFNTEQPYNKSIALYNFNTVWTLINNETFAKAAAAVQNPDNPFYTYVSAPTTVPSPKHYNLLMVYYMPPEGLIESNRLDTSYGNISYFGGAGFRFRDATNSIDTECSKVKIFNKYKKDENNETLFDRIMPEKGTLINSISFQCLFDEFTWWSTDEISAEYTTDDGLAYGYKKLAYDSGDDEAPKPGADAYINSVYFLRPGLNMLVYKDSGTFEFFSDSQQKSVLFLSSIDSVLCKEYCQSGSAAPSLGINLKLLNYQFTDSLTQQSLSGNSIYTAAELQALKDIKDKDITNDFYYNCPMQSATAIDVNLDLLDTTDAEDLSNPKFWYDANNINNKFVISQLDTEHLKVGLKLSKASKLYN